MAGPRIAAGFVDTAQLHARAGDGGAGAVSFRREAHVARGGPDGGDGGDGGSVWLEVSVARSSLLAFQDQPYRAAGNATHGRSARRHGRNGTDLVVAVPPGTIVRDLEGGTVAELVAAGQRWRAAGGGRGGKGNARFATNARRAPSFGEQGEHGEDRWYDLELKLVADAALVGMPNAGKSTLVSRVSAAKPRIADYPFTTLRPHLGVVRVGDSAGVRRTRAAAAGERAAVSGGAPIEEFTLADVPGLIEGASEGRGLGHAFLRHVERARVLVFLLDLSPAAVCDAAEQLRVLSEELARHRPELALRPRLVVGSKLDLLEASGAAAGAGMAGGSQRDLDVSAVTGQGMGELVTRLAGIVADAKRAETAGGRGTGPSVVLHRPAGEGVSVRRARVGVFVIEGREAARAVGLSDLTQPGALDEVQRRLDRLGIDRALNRAGAEAGDTVSIGGFEFTWEP